MIRVPEEVIERAQERAVKHDFRWWKVFLATGLEILVCWAIFYLGVFPASFKPPFEPSELYNARILLMACMVCLLPFILLVMARVEWQNVRWSAVEKLGVTYGYKERGWYKEG